MTNRIVKSIAESLVEALRATSLVEHGSVVYNPGEDVATITFNAPAGSLRMYAPKRRMTKPRLRLIRGGKGA